MRGDVLDLLVSAGAAQRIDAYIAGVVPDASRTQVQRGIRQGAVTLNGQRVLRSSTRVQHGDRIVWIPSPPKPLAIVPEALPLDIQYEDDWMLVVNKAAGMSTHPGPGHSTGTLVHALLHHTGGKPITAGHRPQSEEVGLSSLYEGPHIRPGIVHRLDKDTSGLLLVAKDDVTHRKLAAQFAERTIIRTYYGIIWGVPDPSAGRIEASVGRNYRDRKKMTVVRAPHGKYAATRFRVIEPFAFSALAAFKLETGRTHQIRVHAQHMGHPILGDPAYGGRSIRCGPVTSRRKATYSRLFKQLARQALHAKDLSFVHPHSGEAVSVTAALPADMQAALDTLRRADS